MTLLHRLFEGLNCLNWRWIHPIGNRKVIAHEIAVLYQAPEVRETAVATRHHSVSSYPFQHESLAS